MSNAGSVIDEVLQYTAHLRTKDGRMKHVTELVVDTYLATVPEGADAEALTKIATEVASLTLALLYVNDSELYYLKTERDAYKARLEELLPPPNAPNPYLEPN